jgi:hypothetical protein
MIDLRDAIRCMETIRIRGDMEELQDVGIAVIKKRAGGIVTGYEPGTIVVTRKGNTPFTYTIEIPLNKEELAEQERKGSLLLTKGTIVGVPEKYLDRFILSDFDAPTKE